MTASGEAYEEIPLMPRWLAETGNVVFYLVVALLILGALSFSASNNPNKSLFGFRWYWIETGSMEPDLPVGCLVVVKVVSPEKLQVGDDVTFITKVNNKDKFVTHRVVEIVEPTQENGERSFITKGVANPEQDPQPRAASNAVGKVVFHIAYVGMMMAVLRSNLLGIVAVIICLTAAYILIKRQRNE
jgi:signal peptidase